MDRYGVSRNFNILVTIKFRLDIILLKKKKSFSLRTSYHPTIQNDNRIDK